MERLTVSNALVIEPEPSIAELIGIILEDEGVKMSWFTGACLIDGQVMLAPPNQRKSDSFPSRENTYTVPLSSIHDCEICLFSGRMKGSELTGKDLVTHLIGSGFIKVIGMSCVESYRHELIEAGADNVMDKANLFQFLPAFLSI